MLFATTFLFMIGFYACSWRTYRSIIELIGIDSKYFPQKYKRTPIWMKKNHEIRQQWIPGFMYYYGYTLLPGPLIVSAFVLVLSLTKAQSVYSYSVIIAFLFRYGIMILWVLFMTRIYVGSWKRFFEIKSVKRNNKTSSK